MKLTSNRVPYLFLKQVLSLTLKRLGVNLTPPPYGFPKTVFSRERVKPWFFPTFDIIIDITWSRLEDMKIFLLTININYFHPFFAFSDISLLEI